MKLTITANALILCAAANISLVLKSAKFIGSLNRPSEPGKDLFPEIAFIGRSNVGKSSLINMLCMQKSLAHTSSTPGKTRTANRFLIDDRWILTDLPGYGYAKVGKKDREQFRQLIEKYLLHSEKLMAVCVLIDARIPTRDSDIEFLHWCGTHDLPFFVVFTKCEKIKDSERVNMFEMFMNAFRQAGFDDTPDYFFTSSTSGEGRDALLKFIEKEAINPA